MEEWRTKWPNEDPLRWQDQQLQATNEEGQALKRKCPGQHGHPSALKLTKVKHRPWTDTWEDLPEEVDGGGMPVKGHPKKNTPKDSPNVTEIGDRTEEMDAGDTQAEEHPKEASQAKGETPVEGKPGRGRPVKTITPDCAIGKDGIPGPEQSHSESKDGSPKAGSADQPMAGRSVPAKNKPGVVAPPEPPVLPTPTSAVEPEAQQTEAPQSPAKEANEVEQELATNPICWAQFVGPMMMSIAAAVTSAAVASANPEDLELARTAANSVAAADNAWQRFKEAFLQS